MRDSNRLDNFYPRLYSVHKFYYPDLRFNQFVALINNHIEKTKGIDPFYVKDEDYIKYVEEMRYEL